MSDSDDEAGRPERLHQSRRLFVRSTGVIGLGLTAGTPIAPSQEKDEERADEGDDADSDTEATDCLPTEIEPGAHKLFPDDEFGDPVSGDGDRSPLRYRP